MMHAGHQGKPKRVIGWPLILIPGLLGAALLAMGIVGFVGFVESLQRTQYYDMPGEHVVTLEADEPIQIGLVTAGRPHARQALPPSAQVLLIAPGGDSVPLEGSNVTTTINSTEIAGLYALTPSLSGDYRLIGEGTSEPFTLAVGPSIFEAFGAILLGACGGGLGALLLAAALVLVILRYAVPPKQAA